jgi:hypothetical protein
MHLQDKRSGLTPRFHAKCKAADRVRINSKVRLPMILERLTAWTLVIVYYTVTCGAILLGLKGAL